MSTPMWRYPMRLCWLMVWPLSRWSPWLIAVVSGLGVLGVLGHHGFAWGARGGQPLAQTQSSAMAAGLHAFQRGDIEQAATRWQEAARFYDETHQPQAQGVALTHLASV